MPPKKDAAHFRSLLKIEHAELEKQCKKWNSTMEKLGSKAPDNVKGHILNALGHARLLRNERLRNFANLVDECDKNGGERNIKWSDIEGFWDVIRFQLDEMKAEFAKLDYMSKNKWVEPPVSEPKKLVTSPRRCETPRSRPTTAKSASAEIRQAIEKGRKDYAGAAGAKEIKVEFKLAGKA